MILEYAEGRRAIGSQTAGIKEAREMLDYSIERKRYPEVQIIMADAGGNY